MKVKVNILILAIILLLGQFNLCYADPVGSAFTHQGRLSEVNVPATGTFDFEFKLYDDSDAGSQLGPTLTVTDVNVTKGLFTVELDFGDTVFNGEARWVELAVKGLGDPGFTTLMPRQELTPAPYAIYAAGVVPVGCVVSWLKSFPNTPALLDNFVECNGQTLNDANSPYNGQTIPNLNGANGGTQRFLRGATMSGTTGGSETHSHSISLNKGQTDPFTGSQTNGVSSTGETSTLPSYYEVVWIIRVK